MPTDTLSPADEAAEITASAKKAAKAKVNEAVDAGQKRLDEALDAAERGINDAVRRIEKAVREAVETIRSRAGPYGENAGQQFDDAQRYVVERVKERPVTAALAGLGAGLVLGLLLAPRSK